MRAECCDGKRALPNFGPAEASNGAPWIDVSGLTHVPGGTTCVVYSYAGMYHFDLDDCRAYFQTKLASPTTYTSQVCTHVIEG